MNGLPLIFPAAQENPPREENAGTFTETLNFPAAGLQSDTRPPPDPVGQIGDPGHAGIWGISQNRLYRNANVILSSASKYSSAFAPQIAADRKAVTQETPGNR